MNISDVLALDHVWLGESVSSPAQLFDLIAKRLSSRRDIQSDQIAQALIEREKLGSTAVGDGVATPHARFVGLQEVIGIFVRPRQGLEMDALDGKPVNLLFILLAPDHANADHLKALARVSRVMRSSENQAILRLSESTEAIFSVLISEDDA